MPNSFASLFNTVGTTPAATPTPPNLSSTPGLSVGSFGSTAGSTSGTSAGINAGTSRYGVQYAPGAGIGGSAISIGPVSSPSQSFSFVPPSSSTVAGLASGSTVTPTATETGTQFGPLAFNTQGGGVATHDGQGNLTTYSPGGFNIPINTNTVPSNVLAGSLTLNDLAQKRNQFADYVNALSQAQQYSPDYLAAYRGVQQNQAQRAQLEANLAFGGAPGDTLPYAQGATAKAEVANSIQGLQAQQALDTQALIRQGSIAGANALVQASQPTTVAPGSSLVSPLTGDQTFSGLGGYQAVQGIQTTFNLAQEFPDAGIQPTDSLQVAQQKAAQAPSFQSRNLVQVALPGGGISFVNRNQIATNPATGQATIISAAQGAQADAAKTAINTLTEQRSQIASQISTVDNNFPLLLSTIQKYNLNPSVPLVNQLTNLADKNLGQSGVVQLNAVVTGLKATIAQIVSRGGSVDNQTRNEADALLPGNASLSVLNDLYKTVKAEGQGVLQGLDSQISQQTQSLNTIYNTGSQSGGGGLYDF